MNPTELDRVQIEAIIPHRAPFIFVDRIAEVEYGKCAVGVLDDVGAHEEHVLRGHFPGYPVMPGPIIVEALAQVGAVAVLGPAANHGKLAMLTGLDKWKFRTPSRPGDSVRLEARLLRQRGSFGRGTARATIGDRIAAEGEISFVIVERPVDWA